MAYTTYFERYNELKEKYKICRGTFGLVPPELRNDPVKAKEAKQKNMDKFDVVIEPTGFGYAHSKYRVLKNAPGLPTQDLAIICDEGNLCFGYRTEGSVICIHTD